MSDGPLWFSRLLTGVIILFVLFVAYRLVMG